MIGNGTVKNIFEIPAFLPIEKKIQDRENSGVMLHLAATKIC